MVGLGFQRKSPNRNVIQFSLAGKVALELGLVVP